MKKIFSVFTIFSLILNLMSPFFLAGRVYAQEVAPTETPVVSPTLIDTVTPTPVDSTTPTPTETAVTMPTDTPTPTPTIIVAPTTDPSLTPIVTPTPSIEIPVVSPTIVPSLSPEPTLISQPSATPTIAPNLIWNDQGNNGYETIGNVQIDKEYVAPQNDKVRVTFTSLPDASGKLTIKEVKLTAEQITQTGALSETAYDITSTMADGTFAYNLTLPLPKNTQAADVEIKSAEKSDLSDAQKVQEPKEGKSANTITIKGLNHFTVFVITTPTPDTARSILINEVLPAPSVGVEWVELYNNTASSIDLAQGSGWTIKNSVNHTESLSGLGSIAAGGRMAFDAPANWLSNTAPETITVVDQNGTVVDTVTVAIGAPGIEINHYPNADESVGRLPDGSANWVIFTSPTKGSANVTPSAKTMAGTFTNSYPDWYQDDNGVKIGLCLNNADPKCGLLATPGFNPANPVVFPTNFPSEFFYWLADSDTIKAGGVKVLIRLALEGSFLGGTVISGQQSSFGRIRVTGTGLTPSSTYTVTHPFGVDTFDTNASGTVIRKAGTDNVGCAIAPCDFSLALPSRVFQSFLRWDTGAPAGYLGDGVTLHTVTGSPLSQNFFKIEGPGLPAGGLSTNLFKVVGKLYVTPGPQLTSLNITPSAANIAVGTTQQLSASALDQNGVALAPQPTITWNSSDPTIATVDSAGLVTGNLVGGPVTITATTTVGATTVIGISTINVAAATPVLTSMTIIPSTANIIIGATTHLTENPLDQNGTPFVGANVAWGSSNTNIATVNAAGQVTGIGIGTATITATAISGLITVNATTTVNVISTPAGLVVSRNSDNTVKINPATGFPSFYADGPTPSNRRLQLCLGTNLDGTGSADPNCVLPGITFIPDIRTDIVNFPTEAFYYLADSSMDIGAGGTGKFVLRMAVEGAFVTAAPGQQMSFSRINLKKMSGLAPDSTYLVTYPFGTFQITTDGAGNTNLGAAGQAFRVQDGLGVVGDFVTVLSGANTGINKFLKQVSPIPPSGYIGNGVSLGTIESGPNGNFIRIEAVSGPALSADLDPAIAGTQSFKQVNNTWLVAGKTAINNAPVITAIDQKSVQVGAPLNFTIVASDPDGDTLTYSEVPTSAIGNEAAASINSTTGTFTWTPNTVGTSTFNISVTDGVSSTNASMTVNISAVPPPADTVAPVISILGPNPATVPVAAVYNDAGATAVDNVNGNITANILTTGLPVNTSAIGSFTVTYTVSDTAGNSASTTRTVNVVSATPAGTPLIIATNPDTTININPATALPSFYADGVTGVGTELQPCLGTNSDGTGPIDPNCVLPGITFVPDVRTDLASFPAESFYYLADGSMNIGATGLGKFTLRMAVEGTFAALTPAAGQQTAFSRVNLKKMDGLAPNSTYLVTYPFGIFEITTDATGSTTIAAGQAFRTQDGLGTAGDFTTLLTGTKTGITKFLKQVSPVPPAGYIGNTTPSTIQAGPNGDFIRIEAVAGDALTTDLDPDVAGIQIFKQVNNAWTVAGKLYSPVLTSVTVTPSTATLNIAATQSLTTTITDQNGVAVTGATVNWSSSDTAIATVNTSGLVTAVAAGTATITASVTLGLVTVTGAATITVNTPDTTAPIITMSGVTPVDIIVGTVYADAGATATDNVDPIVTVNTASTVNSNVIGRYTVTYTASDIAGNAAIPVVRTVNVVAAPPALTTINVTPITPTITDAATHTFTAATLDQFGSPFSATVTWTSSDVTVGTINSATGVFTPLKGGTTTVTATSGGVSGSTLVTVQPTLTTINVTPANPTVNVGATQTFSATTLDQFNSPITATVAWSVPVTSANSINPTTGLFSALSAESTVITATNAATGVSGSTTTSVVVKIPTSLTFTQQPSSTALTDVIFSQQPIVTILDQNGATYASTTGSDSVDLAAFTDNACSIPATNGFLGGNVGGAIFTSGVATFTDLTYSFPETIYLRATYTNLLNPVQTFDSPCGSAIVVSPSPVSANLSTVGSNPSTILANGVATSTITVILKDQFSTPVSGKVVTLASSRGASDTISAASGLSDVNGAVTFTVSSSTAGTSDYAATDTTDNLVIAPTANVIYDPNPITVTAAAKTKVYGAADPALTYTITSGALLGTDTLIGSLSRAAGENVGSYAISSTLANPNYTITFVPANLTITQKAITVTAVSDTKVYNGTTASAGIPTISTALIGTDTSGFTQTFDTKNAGTNKTLTPAGIVNDGNGGNNYAVTFATDTTGVINAKTLTATGIIANNKTYNGTTAASINATSAALAGVIAPDIVTLNSVGATGGFADKNVGTGKTVVVSGLTIGGADVANYTLTQPSTTANITAAALAIGATGTNKIYDGTTATTVTLSDNRIAGDVLTTSYGTATFIDKNVGTGKTVNVTGINIVGTDAGNYSFNTTASTTADIATKSLTVSATGINKTYDGTTAATVNFSSDKLAADTVIPTGTATFADPNIGTGKTVTVSGISISGTDAGNYSLANTSALTTADITAPAITITAAAKTKVYGAIDPALTYTITSGALAAGDVLTGSLSRAAGENVGSYAISSTLANSNYTITFIPANLTITASPITVTADTLSKTYGNADPALTYAITGGALIGADSISGLLSRVAGENIGTYAIQQNTLSAGTNYSMTYVGANLTINKRPITVTAVTDSKVFDGTTASSGVPTITSGTLSFADSATWTQTFNTAAVGTGKTLTPAGTVTDGNLGNNYAVTFVPDATGVITASLVPVLATINVTPTTPTITDAATHTFTAATLDQFGSPFSATITWTSSDVTVGTISSTTGVFTPLKGGTTTVTATSGGVSGSTLVTVQPTLTTINVTPVTPTINVGANQQFNAATLDQFNSPITATVAWSVPVTSANSINPTSGLFSALSAESTVVTATNLATGIFGTTTATVNLLDVIAPAVPVISTPAQIVNTSIIHILGTAEANSTITITGGAAIATGTATGGNFDVAVTLNNNVVNNLSVTATDAANNHSLAATVSITHDNILPTVTKLGTGAVDFTIAAGASVNLVFSEALNSTSRLAIQAALTSGADQAITYGWNGAGSTLTITGNATNLTTFANDVMVSVTDLAGNTAVSLLIVDSALAGSQVAPVNGIVSATGGSNQVVITNPVQPVTVNIVGTTQTTVDVKSFITNGTGTLPQITINSQNADVVIPATTTVTGPAGWNGIIAAPTETTVTLPNSPNKTRTVRKAIEIGFASAKLTFDKGVRILLPGQANKRVGYTRPGAGFTEITNICAADSQVVGDGLPVGGDCKISVGADMVVWTKHFTQFASYDEADDSPVSGQGSGVSDGLSDGLGCGNHDCNTTTLNKLAASTEPAIQEFSSNTLNEATTNQTGESTAPVQEEVKGASTPSTEKGSNVQMSMKLFLEIIIGLFVLGSVGFWIAKSRKKNSIPKL